MNASLVGEVRSISFAICETVHDLWQTRTIISGNRKVINNAYDDSKLTIDGFMEMHERFVL